MVALISDIHCQRTNCLSYRSRYSSYQSLLSVLKKEVIKVKKLSPNRYYICTSVGLTPDNKLKIQSIFGEDILNTQDILGKDDLNNLLGL